MNSTLIQSASSIFLALIALLCIFIPYEIVKKFIITKDAYVPLVIQLSGGLGFGFAMTNWMSRTVAMGGIYSKAIYMGNLSQFLIGAMALLKWAFQERIPFRNFSGDPHWVYHFSYFIPAPVFQQPENGRKKIKELIETVTESTSIIQNH